MRKRRAKSAAAESFDLRQRKAEHWAWQPIRAHEPPAVKNASWPKDPLAPPTGTSWPVTRVHACARSLDRRWPVCGC